MGSLWLNSFLKLLSGPETLLITNPWGPLMTQRPQDLPFHTPEKKCCYRLVSLQSVENGSTSHPLVALCPLLVFQSLSLHTGHMAGWQRHPRQEP